MGIDGKCFFQNIMFQIPIIIKPRYFASEDLIFKGTVCRSQDVKPPKLFRFKHAI